MAPVIGSFLTDEICLYRVDSVSSVGALSNYKRVVVLEDAYAFSAGDKGERVYRKKTVPFSEAMTMRAIACEFDRIVQGA